MVITKYCHWPNALKSPKCLSFALLKKRADVSEFRSVCNSVWDEAGQCTQSTSHMLFQQQRQKHHLLWITSKPIFPFPWPAILISILSKFRLNRYWAEIYTEHTTVNRSHAFWPLSTCVYLPAPVHWRLTHTVPLDVDNLVDCPSPRHSGGHSALLKGRDSLQGLPRGRARAA